MLRIGGIASGIDTESIIRDLMRVERLPLDRLKQKKQKLEWQRDEYRAINTLLLEFRSQLTTMRLSSTYRSRLVTSTDESKLNVSVANGASLSSYTISKVTQLASAETKVNEGKIHNGTFDPSKALYAQADNFVTGNKDLVWKSGAIYSKSITTLSDGIHVDISDIAEALENSPNKDALSIKVNGVGYKVITSGTPGEKEVLLTGNQLQFGKSIDKGSTIKIDYIADNRTDTLKMNAKTNSWQLSQGAIDGDSITSIKLTEIVEVEGEQPSETSRILTVESGPDANTKNIKDGDTIVGTLDLQTGKITFNENMIKPDEENNLSITLEATYSHKYTTFSMDTITSKGKMHESFIISGSDTLNSVINKVNASQVGVTMFYDTFSGQLTLTRKETGDYNNGASQIETNGSFINDVLQFGNATIKEKGQNAKFEMNGLETERNSNTFTVNGVTFTIKQIFDDSVNVSVSNNSQQIFDNIKTFVEKYNELIEAISKKLNEEVYRSYQPLTDEEKEQLSDKQQEKWEEMAKSGLLRRDPILQSVLSEMRMDFYSPVKNDNISGAFSQLAQIGITTTANYLEGGKLEINETKLREAIEQDPESIELLFNATGETESQKGIINRLYETVSNTMDKLRTKAGNSYSAIQTFTIGKELVAIDKQIDRFEDRLTKLENRYWSQFTAMEKAMQKANEQSAYLMQFFSM